MITWLIWTSMSEKAIRLNHSLLGSLCFKDSVQGSGPAATFITITVIFLKIWT